MMINSKHCGKLLTAEQALYSGGLAMVLPRNSNITSAMSYATLKIINEVATPNMEKYFASIPSCSAKHGTALNFRKLRLFFSIAFCTGAILLMLRFITNAWRKAKEISVDNKEESQDRGITKMPSSNCSTDTCMCDDIKV